jgi:hypothetical protein
MKKIWEWIKNNPNRTMFLVPIFLVAGISISHVVSWYDIANPFSWAVYLSIAIEIGAMTALVAATNKIKGGVWFMFGLITLIQMIGNVFFSYKEIDANSDLFKSWVELTGPLFEGLGSDPSDIISQKRWLAFLEGGLLPIISLTSLHFFTKYESSEKEVEVKKDESHIEDVKLKIRQDEQQQVEIVHLFQEEVSNQVPTKYPPSTHQVTDQVTDQVTNQVTVHDEVTEIFDIDESNIQEEKNENDKKRIVYSKTV